MVENPKCPSCGSDTVKAGFRYLVEGRRQKYKCKSKPCSFIFVPEEPQFEGAKDSRFPILPTSNEKGMLFTIYGFVDSLTEEKAKDLLKDILGKLLKKSKGE